MWHNLASPNLEKIKKNILSFGQKYVSTLVRNTTPLQVAHWAWLTVSASTLYKTPIE